MTTSQQATSLLNTTREAEPKEHAEAVVNVQNPAPSMPDDLTTERNRITDDLVETILPPPHDYRPFAYPAWPTSKPGPQVTSPPPGQHPHPMRADQMVYEYYDQELGLPCVPPPRPIMLRQGTKRPKIDFAESGGVPVLAE
jgi:hypothetical protein